MAEGSDRVEVHIPADRDDAIERYRDEAMFHAAIDWFAQENGYSRDQLIAGKAGQTITVPKMFVGLA